jgi:hypothetical protein
MTDRSRARAALKKLDEELEPKLRRREQLIRELRRSLHHEAYEERPLFLHPSTGVPLPSAETLARDSKCRECGGAFYPGETVVEYVDDDGTVVARYHRGCGARAEP